MMFSLHPGLDSTVAAERYAAAGHVRLCPFLADADAAALHAALRARLDWRQIVNSGDKVFELDRATRSAMTAAERQALDAAVVAGAREGFQHRYEAIRLPDGDAADDGGEVLGALTRWLSSEPVMALLRRVTGSSRIAFADGQATAYSPGDFLTGHDDAVPGKQRHAAYVLGLTPVWRIDWGGLLLFHHTAARITGVSPGYNTIDLFRVPQMHSVSAVSAAAAFRRYAVTGWLRCRQ